VGFEDLDTYDAGGALTYSINDEECLIAVSIALNFPINPLLQCASLVYVGFELQPESVSPACTTSHLAELSIEHVKINEAGMNACWMNGWIHYVDYTLGGDIYYSDTGIPVWGAVVEFSNLVTVRL
jgi:hypothetical protein